MSPMYYQIHWPAILLPLTPLPIKPRAIEPSGFAVSGRPASGETYHRVGHTAARDPANRTPLHATAVCENATAHDDHRHPRNIPASMLIGCSSSGIVGRIQGQIDQARRLPL